MDDRLIDGHGGTMPFLCRLVTSIASYGRPKRVIHVPRFHDPLSTGVPLRYVTVRLNSTVAKLPRRKHGGTSVRVDPYALPVP
jgi:hypothetical protein